MNNSTLTPTATGKIRRIKCPVHGGKNLSAAVGFTNGRPWAKCHSRDCSSADILAALNLGNPPKVATVATFIPPPKSATVADFSITPLPPVSPTQGREYLAGIGTPKGATIAYQRRDGRRGKHWRNLDKRRNPGVKGDGWQVRRFNPPDPTAAVAVALAEGEKDAAILALAGLIAFCAPRGATSLKTADFSELVSTAKETGLPVMLCGDNDDVGSLAMRRIGELLRKAGLHPIDTAWLAPLKGSIADLPGEDLVALVNRLILDRKPRWQKLVRNQRKYAEFRCLRPKHWQGRAGDTSTVNNLRSCENTAVCGRCALWAVFEHIERVVRGDPAQLVEVSGFGDELSTIPETVGLAKTYRERMEGRLRKSSYARQKEENPSGERRNFLTALRIRDDYRAGLALILDQQLSENERARERARAERAGLTFRVVNNPTRADIEAIAPQSLSINMEGQGDTTTTRTWTSSGWPDWEENPTTYAFSDGRELADGEDFEADSITVAEWKRDNRQSWDSTLPLRANLERREDYALHNSQLWMSSCTGLNAEILRGIANATSATEIAALVEEVGDYEGPVSLLRDTAHYLSGLRPWRKAFGPVLAVAGIGG